MANLAILPHDPIVIIHSILLNINRFQYTFHGGLLLVLSLSEVKMQSYSVTDRLD